MSAATSAKPTFSLPVAGIIPFSTVDWPGKITITVFTQGCPLRCVYCHNPSLQSFAPGAQDFSTALDLAAQQRSLIDAVVISGGEPTAMPGLGAAIDAVHDVGLPVGLHTCGYRPAQIAALLAEPASTPDWVGLDIKALPRHMPAVTGCAQRLSGRAWESLRLLQAARVDVQVRTTLWAGSVIAKHLPELQALVRQAGFELVVQQARAADGSPFRLGV